jgi:hypothetical protein
MAGFRGAFWSGRRTDITVRFAAFALRASLSCFCSVAATQSDASMVFRGCTDLFLVDEREESRRMISTEFHFAFKEITAKLVRLFHFSLARAVGCDEKPYTMFIYNFLEDSLCN